MSELTLCNYCSYKRSKQLLEEAGKKVELKPSTSMPGFVALVVDGEEKGWYMEVPTHCCC